VILWKTSHSASEGDTTVTAPSSIDPVSFLHDQLASASPDLLRSMLTTFVNTLMSA
jgi:putative transposase